MNTHYFFKLFILLFLVTFCSINSSCFSQITDYPTTSVTSHLTKKDDKYRMLFTVNNILQKDKNNKDALFTRGKLKCNMGAYKSAQADFTKALHLQHNKKIEIFYHRGISYYLEKDFLNAIADFDSVINLQPKHIDALWRKAQCYYYIGANALTIDALDEITVANPESPITWHDMGTLYYKNNNLNKAKDCFTKALILAPHMSVCYNHRGIVYETMKNYSMAFDDFNRAIFYDSTYADAYNNRGLIYLNYEDYQQAEQDFSSSIEHDQFQPKEALNNRAVTRYILGDYDGSMNDINKLLDHYPFFAKAYITRGNIKERKHDDNGACSDWNKAAELGDLQGIEYTQKTCQ
ncbi:tetratricopeptide repeat protein [Flammeovirga pectinis]|uniref:Tetratricopeptide repeat protein n=1 Tax=Flammeovirga pectinis TaxID=2494373 RepID=A0A3S9P2W8_9BACT|nr:tetratricopeptide repeat protein [Flammeovirga pectinis]AZQ62556.1 tetratricopeptide repeat protein [Flammeovirga pectinis]